MKKIITEISIDTFKKTFLTHPIDTRKKILANIERGKKEGDYESTAFKSEVDELIKWAKNNLKTRVREHIMKKAELRKIIKEEIKIVLKEEVDATDIYDMIEKSMLAELKKIKIKHKAMILKKLKKYDKEDQTEIIDIAANDFHDQFLSDNDIKIVDSVFGGLNS